MSNAHRASFLADRLGDDENPGSYKLIEEALNEAEARGRKAGLEEAAKVAETVNYVARCVDDVMSPDIRASYKIIEAIRKLIPLGDGLKK